MYSSISSIAGSVLGCIRKDITGASPWYFDPLIRFAQRVPAFSGNMIELHFDRKHWFDFSLRINTQYDRVLIPEWPLREQVSCSLQEGYQQLLNEDRNGFAYGIENLWFEYDFPVSTDPSLFFDLHRNTELAFNKRMKDLAKVCALFGYSLPKGLTGLLAGLYENGHRVHYYGLMFSRQPAFFRFTIPDIAPEQLSDVLQQIGWEGDYSLVAAMEAQYLQSFDRIAIALDHNGQLGSRLGVEAFTEDTDAAVELFHQKGAFNKDQYQLLKQWQGKVTLDPGISSVLSELHQREICYVHKRINHFKFILDKDQVTGKAYLYYCY
jgi:hypothetical protein